MMSSARCPNCKHNRNRLLYTYVAVLPPPHRTRFVRHRRPVAPRLTRWRYMTFFSGRAATAVIASATAAATHTDDECTVAQRARH